MDARFHNGVSVNRTWAELEPDSVELLAVFQYESHAIGFATAKAADDSERSFNAIYIVSNSCSGKVTIIHARSKATGQ